MMLPKNSRAIPLSKGKQTIVSQEDFAFLSQWRWHYHNEGYAVRSQRIKGTNHKKMIRMHSLIMNTPAGMITDHINGDTLDNRRSNLRICTTRQNRYNAASKSGSSSKYKGVSWQKHRKHWIAGIKVGNVKKYIGSFPSEAEAADAYDKAASQYFGEFARLNRIGRQQQAIEEVCP